MMYGHPLMVKKWAKAMKPNPTPEQVEQARIMRKAKAQKRAFLIRQRNLFSEPADLRVEGLDLSKEIAEAEKKLAGLSDQQVFELSHRLLLALIEARESA